MRDDGWPRSILIFAPSVDGGIPHYTHHQAAELARRGIAVTMLCPGDHPWDGKAHGYRQIRALASAPGGRSVWHKALSVLNHVWIHYQLLWYVLRLRPDAVIFEANTEFYGALWAWPHILLSWLGTIYVMTLHDPVRGLWFGPKWFSRLSLWAAYRLLSGGLVHGDPPPTTYRPKWLKIASVPHGLFDHMERSAPPYDLRAKLRIPRDSFLLLSFGHIADRKNQHLLVEAVSRLPGASLVIAGPQMSRRNRPPEFYRELAEKLGCADRVHVVHAFIEDAEVPAYFAAADAVALTYDGGFLSQSGVLQIAGQWDKPVLASGGEGVLKDTIQKHDLGLFVTPDNADAVEAGLAFLMADRHDRSAGFAAFRDSASWAANVDGLLGLLREIHVQRRR